MTSKTWSRRYNAPFRSRTVRDEYVDYFGVTQAKSDVTSETNSTTDYADYIVGGDQPAWLSILKRGDNVTNVLNGQKTVVSPSRYSGACKVRLDLSPPPRTIPFREYSINGFPPMGAVTSGSPDDSAFSAAQVGFASKASKRISSFAGGTFLGELGETIHMLRHPATGIRGLLGSYLDQLKRNRSRAPKNSKRRRKYVADQWLEYSFGLMPLISDCTDGAKTVARLINDMPPSEHVVYHAGRENKVSETGVSTHTSGLLSWTDSVLVKDITTSTIYGAVKLENPHSGTYLRETVGIRPDLFVPTIWELIPYSWLVDYFSNVGDVISAACFNMARLRWIGATTVVNRQTTVRFHGDATDKSIAGLVSSYASGGNNVMETKTIHRFVPNSLVPPLSINLPNKWSQWVNMSAVAVQHSRLIPY
jgi:hypothetical protein